MSMPLGVILQLGGLPSNDQNQNQNGVILAHMDIVYSLWARVIPDLLNGSQIYERISSQKSGHLD